MEQAYAYKVRTRSGQLMEGEMAAPELRSVVEHLWRQNYVIVSLEPKSNSIWDKDILALLKTKYNFQFPARKVKAKELGFFCRQLATMISSGIPLLACLSILNQQKGSAKLNQAIGKLKEELEEGQSIAEAARSYPDVFPPIFTNMVEAGEVGGALDEVLIRLANHFDKEHEVAEKVKSAMTYPIIIFLVAVAAIGFLIGFILPKFAALLENFNVDLPILTRLVLGASSFLGSFWYVIIALVGIGFIVVRKKLEIEKNKLWWDTRILTLPVFGDLIRKREVSRFARTLGTLLRSGVPILQALEVVKKTTDNLLIQGSLVSAQQSIRDGEGVAAPLSKGLVFPSMVIQMINTGEETGTLEEMLERISVFYDQEVDAIVSRLSTLIEPFFIVTLGLTIGFILLAVLLPIFKVVTSVQ